MYVLYLCMYAYILQLVLIILRYLSAMAPLTIVVAVVAKDNWNKKAAKICPIKGSPTGGSSRKSPTAMNGFESGPRP